MKFSPFRHLLALFGFLSACVFLAGCGGNSGRPTSGNQSSEPKLQVVRVKLPVKKRVRSTTTQPASVHPYYQARIQAKIAGYLEKFYFDIGDTVAKDKLLATIHIPEFVERKAKQKAFIEQLEAQETQRQRDIDVANSTFEAKKAELAQAKAETQNSQAALDAAKIEYDRKNKLVQSARVSEKIKDEAKARLDAAQAHLKAAQAAERTAKANIAIAKAQIGIAKAKSEVATAKTKVATKELAELKETMAYAKLTAPFSGTIVARNVEPGDLVHNSETTSGQRRPLFVIADFTKVRVRVMIPERDTPLVKLGASATIHLLAFKGQPIHSKVSRMSNSLHEKTRTMLVEIDLDNKDGKLRPGMFGDATVELEDRANCLVLPAPYVRYDKEGNGYVLVADQKDRVQKVKVSTGLDDGQQIEITKGIDSNARVIAPTPRRLKVGQQIKVSEND